ncbi:MAG: D-aminoacyl-tRNA deacylase, partial [Spirochaetales bacterium]|nr:D-aminoacyl-tRNA deacylase [Spirochaetales bacterium]
ERFLEKLSAVYDKNKIQTGRFAAMMDVALHNDGPCTILLDSERGF